eukprot:scaffold3541_cov252-Pinguiococcus_pyrenoidosus.AAC.3
MARICGSNPMSSIRSASSSTRNASLPRLIFPRPMKSTSRPGVATMTSAPCRSSCSCSPCWAPPSGRRVRVSAPAPGPTDRRIRSGSPREEAGKGPIAASQRARVRGRRPSSRSRSARRP